jgi:5-(carboxyamino)imidazole ribonucleotide synthase
MLLEAAVPMDVDVRILSADAAEGAGWIARDTLTGSWSDEGDLLRLAEGCDVVTFDHELTPGELLASLAHARTPLAPTAATMRVASDKTTQRKVAAECGLRVPPWFAASDPSTLRRAVAHLGLPAVVKMTSGGYDGRGVRWLRDRDDLHRLISEGDLGPSGVLVEPALPITAELATQVVRRADGERVVYPVVRTVQRNGICTLVTAPATTSPALAHEAQRGAVALAERLDHVGVLAVEYFVVNGSLMFNELAPRPHNSGHYTIDACTTSQFENHLRAVLGWPLGDPSMTVPASVMANVIGTGDPLTPLSRMALPPGTRVHLYGKNPAPGRKLGHVTSCGHDRATLARLATETADHLAGIGRAVMPTAFEEVGS